jgi:purine nucleosidase
MMNIGALFASDPEIPSLLRALVVMCGCFFEPRPYSHEWNARLDPTATAIVYGAHVPEHRSVGLDVTMQCKMSAPDAIRRFRELGGALSVVAAMADTRPRPPGSEMIFHDPLTGVSVFEPTLCAWESGDVSVELLSRAVAGMTHFEPNAEGRHRAARRVDPERFFARYFSVFGNA